MRIRLRCLAACAVTFLVTGAGPQAASASYQGARGREGPRLPALIQGLGAPELEARAASERGLSAALAAGSTSSREGFEGALAALRTALAAGSASDPGTAAIRRRLGVILGGDDRFFGLGARLAADGRPVLRDVGLSALTAQLSRWSVSAMAEPSLSAYDIPRQALALPRPLVERAAFRLALDPNGALPGGLANTTGSSAAFVSGAAAFDLLDRRGGAPLPIVVDPSFVERMARRPAVRLGAKRIEGPWNEVLEQLCAIHDGGFQLQGYRFPNETYPADLVGPDGTQGAPPARGWIHVVQRGTTQLAPVGRDLREPGAQRILRWCTAVLAEGNLIRQGAAARALAVLGIPAAIQWLERRWAWYGDVVALEGLMAAAARQRVAPSLQDPRCIRAILALLEEDARELGSLRAARQVALAPQSIQATGERYLDAAGRLDGRLRRVALGLRSLVPSLVVNAGSPGAPPSAAPVIPLTGVLFEEFVDLTPESQWLRLAVAEGLGVSSPDAAFAAQLVLEDRRQGGFGGALRRQALRTLGAVGDSTGTGVASLRLARPELLFATEGPGARDLTGLGLELGRAEPMLPIARSGFPGSAVLRDRLGLTELLIWAALATERRGGAAPAWAARAVKAAVQEWLASTSPNVRDVDRSALVTAAVELARTGGGAWLRLQEAVRPSLDQADRAALESVTLRAGGLARGAAGAQARLRALERALADLGRSTGDEATVERAWLDLAALAGDEWLGRRARGALVESFSVALTRRSSGPAATSTMLVFAAEKALQSLQEAREDTEAAGFRRTLRQVAQVADHPLAQRFFQVDWPPAPRSAARDLERAEPVRPPLFLFP